VLKTLTIALVMDIPATAKKAGEKVLANARGLDLSRAKAADAYWAKTDFTYADFYHADLSAASFRNSVLQGAQFRQANLSGAVLAGADCKDANFKLADLSGVDFSDADLRKANFEGATIHGTNFAGAKIRGTILTGIDAADNPGANVHISEAGDGSKTMKVSEWLNQSRPKRIKRWKAHQHQPQRVPARWPKLPFRWSGSKINCSITTRRPAVTNACSSDSRKPL